MEWVRQRLQEYLKLLDDAGLQNMPPVEAQTALLRAQPTLWRILEALGLDVAPTERTVNSSSRYAQRVVVQQALGILEDAAEVEDGLGHRGPELEAEGLHPWVWGAAAPHWDGGQYRTAVATAAGNLSLKVQAKLDRWDIADDELMTESLSSKPAKPGQPRLRVPATPGRRFEEKLQEGTLWFARGVFSVLRNPSTHKVDEVWSEQRALEALAALSILARALDEATVERSDEVTTNSG